MGRWCVDFIKSFCVNALRVSLAQQKDPSLAYAEISAPANVNARPTKTWSVAATPTLRVVNGQARVRSRPCLDSFM